MSKKPILVLTGMAVAAVAAVAGLTRDQWLASAPQTVAGSEAAKTPEAVASNSEQASAPAQPATGQPAAKTEPPAPPAAAQPASATAAPAQPEATRQQTAVVQPGHTAPAAAPAQPAKTTEVLAQPSQSQPAASAQTQPVPAAEAPAQQGAARQPAPVPAQSEATQPQTATAQPGQTAPAAAPAAPAETAKAGVPSFDTVRVEKTGEAVIAGTAKAGSDVVVKLDGQEIGKTTANSDGAFVLVPDAPLPKGSGALTIESKGKGDLQAAQSEQTVAVIVPEGAKNEALVAVVSPNAPTKVLQKPETEAPAETPAAAKPDSQGETQVAAVQSDADANSSQAQPQQPAVKPSTANAKSVSIDAVDYDSAGNIMFSGQGEPGHTARVYVDNNFAGDAPVGNDGRWTHSGRAEMASGVHALRVDDVDPAGKVANRVEVPFYREDQSKVAAAVPEVSQPAGQSVAKTEPAAPQQQAAAAGTQGAATITGQPREGRVVIQPGNNLWRISRVLYGSGEKYTMLYKANKDQIRNPDLIYPGQIFKTPEVAAKIESIDPKRRDPLKPEENAPGAQ